MIVVKLKGGLGNQMFQYAFGLSLSKERNEKFFIDISGYSAQSKNDAQRNYQLGDFPIQAEILPNDKAKIFNSLPFRWYRKITNKINPLDAYTFNSKLLQSKSTYYEGYWINEKYFIKYRQAIIESFALKNFSDKAIQISKLIHETQKTSTSLHVRRGDFVSNPNAAFNGLVSLEHYHKAINLIAQSTHTQKLTVFVFSDDIEWAKNNIHSDDEHTFHFVSSPEIKDHEELILMSQCSNNIIANSTFSWWAAWLNQSESKIVIAPKQWLKDRTASDLEITPENWILL
jgi:hypothetical protein